MKFRNFTPHTIRVIGDDGICCLEVQPEGVQVRVEEKILPAGEASGIPCVSKEYTNVIGLPPESPDVINIVSVLVLTALGGTRPDVVCPDTGPDSVVRNEKGHIIGVRRFQI